jgi:hypothetical protein
VIWALPSAQTLPTPARATSPNRKVTSLFNMGPLIVRSEPTPVKEPEKQNSEAGIQEKQPSTDE